MAWTLAIKKSAAKQLEKLDKPSQKRIIQFLREKIEGTSNPRKLGKALKGHADDLWRYRIGDYRLICSLDDHTLTILAVAVGHRKNIYEK